MRILSTGAGGTAARNFCECLFDSSAIGPKPIVTGTDVNKYHMELNEFLDERYVVPPCSDSGYVDALNEVIKREEIEYVHPQPDVEVLAIARARDRVKARTFLPRTETIELCQDKMKTNETLQSKLVPVARSSKVEDESSLRKAVGWFLSEPDSPGKVWLRAVSGAGSKAAVPVYSGDEAVGHVRLWSHRGLDFKDFMVCEYLPGQDYAWSSLWKDGELVTSQIRQRIMYMLGFLSPSGMSSTPSVAVTVHDARVNETATDAVRAVDPRPDGTFYIDLKENGAGVPCVTEINAGRFNATINFFAHAGINMPYYHVKMAFDEEIPELPRYDAAPAGQYWVRQIDMGHRLLRSDEFRAVDLTKP